MFRTGRGISVMLFSVLAGGCSLSYDTSVGYIVDAYYIDETTGEVVTKKTAPALAGAAKSTMYQF